MPFLSVIRTHLELRGPSEFRRSEQSADGAELVLLRPIVAADYRALYILVGERWMWRDRLVWSDAELNGHLLDPRVHVWTVRLDGTVAGFFELLQRSEGDVELQYFGLAPDFIGRGLGGWFLSRAVDEAFALGAWRVVLNTCTLDGPRALPNYLARGFTIVREEEYLVDVPRPPDPASD